MASEHEKFVEELIKQIKEKIQKNATREPLSLKDVLVVFEDKEQLELCMDLSEKIQDLLAGHKGYMGIMAISISCATYYMSQVDSMVESPEYFGSAIGRVIALFVREFMKEDEEHKEKELKEAESPSPAVH